jgi:hypothetical protein
MSAQSLTVTPGAQLTAQAAQAGDTLTLYIPSLKGGVGVSYSGGVHSYSNPGAPSPKLVLSGGSGQVNLAWTTMQNAPATAKVAILAVMPAHSWPAPTPPASTPAPPPFNPASLINTSTLTNQPAQTAAPTPTTPVNTASPIPSTSTNTSTTITTTAQAPATTSAAPASSTGRTVALVAAGVGVAALATYGVWRYGKRGKRRR